MNKSVEKIFVITIDFLTINISWLAYSYFRTETGLFNLVTQPAVFLAGVVVFFYWLIIFTIVGMYRTWFASSRFDELSTLFKSSFVGIFIIFFIILLDDYATGYSSSNRFLIFVYWGVFLASVGSGRLLIRSLQRFLLIKGIGRRNALIIGYNSKGREIHDRINRYKALGLDIVGYVAEDNDYIGEHNGIKVLGGLPEFEDLADKAGVTETIIALDRHDDSIFMDVIAKCDNKNISLKIVPDLYDIISGQVRTAQLYAFPLIDIMPQLMPEWEKKIKRVLDIFFSLLFLILTLPITLIVSFLIKMESKGPVVYKQERAGMNGKVFNMYKFRSMYLGAERQSGPTWAQKHDPRVTKVGRVIRKLRIDEIPQMVNIFKGEMSLVGPRPERPYFVEMLSKEIPLYRKRLRVRPGLTGWAQIKHKYDESVADVRVKLRYDLFYIENMSLRMDFNIIFRTIFVVLFGKGHFE
jgi:exopolysaccharide biosynthesis polyprenyl glycosylphosphotransferase